jgi:hypothetical protein
MKFFPDEIGIGRAGKPIRDDEVARW